jgi:hypothetical protein
MPGAKVITKQKKAFKDSQTRRNMKNAKPRPQQKQKPKSQLKKKIKKGFEDFTRGFKKGLKNPIGAPLKIIKDKITSGSKAKASTIKPKKKPKKETSREANARAAGVTGKMPGAKDSQLMKAEKDRRARSKAKAAKKKERDSRADARDAKRGGFISANAMKSSAKNANAKMAANKKRKSDELISRGRR